jgi:cellobiose-specific phosphotransferase system component IIA
MIEAGNAGKELREALNPVKKAQIKRKAEKTARMFW